MLEKSYIDMQTKTHQPRKSDFLSKQNPLYLDWIIYMIKQQHFVYPLDYLHTQSANNSIAENEYDNF